MNISSHRSGQALVEVLVALAALIVGFMGTIILLSQSIAANRNVTDRNIATYLAAEALEVTKNLIDANILTGSPPCFWDDGFGAGDYVVNDDSYPSGGSCPGQALQNTNPNNIEVLYNPQINSYRNNIPPLPGYDATKFTRIIRVTRPDPDLIVVNALVNWVDQAGPAEVNVEDQFVNWRI